MEGKQHIYRMEFEKAQDAFVKSQEAYPDYPHGYVYQAYITSLFFALDQSNDSLARALDEQLKHSIDIAKDYKDRFHDSAGSYFHLALANSIKALYHIVDRNYFKGYWYGRKAKGDLNKVIELDSTYYDAYLGLGMFHYYADLLPGFLKFVAGILGFDGDRLKGKSEIYRTAQKGHFFKIESEFLYHSIDYFLEGNKEKAFQSLQKMYQRYPTNQGLGIMLAYHYRRTGFIQQCIKMCEKLLRQGDVDLPQITIFKYYNLAVCYYDLNTFDRADSLFTVMDTSSTRKSLYYQAAIAYYKGHLADLRFDREQAVEYYQKIAKHKQTKYWYWFSRSLLKYPTDSLLYRYFVAVNFIGGRQHTNSFVEAAALWKALKEGKTSPNPDIHFLAGDILARNYYARGQFDRTQEIYAEIIPNLDKMEDKIRRSWIYIHYYYYLKATRKYKEAEEMLKKADDIDDDFTRIIVERERFILKKKIKTREEMEG
jgi:tetratricopeptide (TPR) repeat protein